MQMVNIFKEKGATSSEAAKTPEELGLPPHFAMMMYTRIGQLGVIAEDKGRYYLVEDKIDML
jgi:hypothetical protein